MASVSSRRFKNLACLLTFLLVAEIASLEDSNIPEFFNLEAKAVSNVTVNNGSYTKILFEVRGRNIYPQMRVKVTQKMSQRNAHCEDADFSYNISEIRTDKSWGQYNLTVPQNVGGKLYFCLPHQTKEVQQGLIKPSLFSSEVYEWFHQGPTIMLQLSEKKVEKK